MAWKISGQSMEHCSCKMFCPCWLGPEGEPDQGWCVSALGYEIQEGSSDGVDLNGTKVLVMAEWPGNFFAGNGTARLYIDETASAEQRRELEAIFSGSKGGPLESLFGAVISTWLPAESTKVEFSWGETPTVAVDGVGQASLSRLKDAAGRPTQVQGAVAQAAFQMDSMELASSKGSSWTPSDMHSWQGDSGTLHSFDWSQ